MNRLRTSVGIAGDTNGTKGCLRARRAVLAGTAAVTRLLVVIPADVVPKKLDRGEASECGMGSTVERKLTKSTIREARPTDCSSASPSRLWSAVSAFLPPVSSCISSS